MTDASSPLLYIENDRRDKSPALISKLRGLGYRLYWHLPSLFNAANFFGNREDVFPRVVSMNLVCIPGEQNTAVKDAREVRDNADRPIE